MPDTYSITIHNASNNPEEFFLFHAVPKPAEIPSPDIFSNVYLKSPQILGDGTSSVTFQTSNEYYAIYGTSVQSTDGKVRVGTSDYQPVKLGPHGSYFVLKAAEDGLSPQRDQAASAGKTTEVPGAFTIETDSSFRYPNPSNSYFGIGAKDPSTDEVVPVQTYPAKPAEVSQLFPKPKYYIASGSNQPGSIIETMKIGNEATFTLDSKGQYVPGKMVTGSGIIWSFGPPGH
ncbi:hypothetical protein QBC35DRAFT_516875 [Podospora australis]|uniref:Uncharacterized protein n=1 Tax=Podospora australis TaxID=1536484 RepID=A0AAN7AED8_9PEZI|nr:hypothetical protein QBC35DRAFT_516875 [Podospora australis]